MNKLYRIGCKFLAGLSLVVLVYLTFYSARYTHLFPVEYVEQTYVEKDSVLSHALIFGLMALVLFGMTFLRTKLTKFVETKWFRVCAMCIPSLLFLGVGVWFVFDGTVYIPGGDPGYIHSVATSLAENDFSVFEPGSYVSQYPYQLGLVLFVEILVRMFGSNSVMALIVCNLLAVAWSVYLSYRLCRILWKGSSYGISILFLLMTPAYLYPCFLYGECMALPFVLLLFYNAIKFKESEKKQIRYLVVMCICGAAATIFRANSMIAVIAVMIFYLLELLKRFQPRLLLAVILIPVSVFLWKGAVNLQYEMRSDMQLQEGIPSSAWIAMGMQEGIRGNGWYNEYGVELYIEHEYDTETVDRISKQYIMQRMQEFLKNPGTMYRFYSEKMLSQWNEPTLESLLVYRSCVDTNRISQKKYDLMFGKWYRPYISFLNYFQTLLYALMTVYAAGVLFGKSEGKDILLLLFFLGGFSFQILWEAKSRYIFYYMMLMLPMAAGGIRVLTVMLQRLKDKMRKSS